MDLRKKTPRFLLESSTLTGSVIAIILFSILFMLIYGPYSSTSWITLNAEERVGTGGLSRFHAVMASVVFYLVAIAFLVLSKVVLYHVARRYRLRNLHAVCWIGGEIVMISFIYTVFTALFNLADSNLFFPIWGRSVIVLSFIIIVPYVICVQHAINRHQSQLLNRLGMDVASDKVEDTDPKLIHLVDNVGRLKMSISIDSLYYVESQDNYVKIYYDSDGKLCSYMLRSTTKAIETRFGHWLVRCHRGYLVNKNKIHIFCNDRDGMYIRLMHEGIRQIPVSKSYAQSIRNMLAQDTTKGYQE